MNKKVRGFLLLFGVLLSATNAQICIFLNPDTAGLSEIYGILVDDLPALKSNWKVGKKVSQIDYCVDSLDTLVGFYLTIADQNKNGDPTKLSMFGVSSKKCSSVGLEANEYISEITFQFSRWHGRFTQIDFKTTQNNFFSIGKRTGYAEKFKFNYLEPFIGFYGIRDPKTSGIEQIGVYTEKCTFKELLNPPAPSSVSAEPVQDKTQQTSTQTSNTSTPKWDPSSIPDKVSIPTGIGGVNVPSIEKVTGQLNSTPVETKTNTQSNSQTKNQNTSGSTKTTPA